MRSTGVMWFRRDLRLADNQALTEALGSSDSVVPVFVLDPKLNGSAGPARRHFLLGCLRRLSESLGGRLLVRSGDPLEVLPALCAELGASTVWCTADFAPYGISRDQQVAAALAALGCELRAVDSPYAIAPGRLLSATGQPYQVFTPFSKAWRQRGWRAPSAAPEIVCIGNADLPPAGVAQIAASSPDALPPGAAHQPEPGEEAAHCKLDDFVETALDHYGDRRDFPAAEATSRLSAYLHFGCLHPRQILARLDPANASHRRYETELCWRDFYADVLYNRPESAYEPYKPEWCRLEVDTGPQGRSKLTAWQQGRTGYPIVDAGMRQLLAEGWMHNRVRMIVASFLVKDLHIDWREGARYFMRHLVDADLASNQHGWQWVAGTGTDAAPYFRIFNPVLQGKKFDPAGEYIRRWIPELAALPDDSVHEPWVTEGTLFGRRDYPAPIVDHFVERSVALARYGALRQPAGNRSASRPARSHSA